jgi:hypothetical protein
VTVPALMDSYLDTNGPSVARRGANGIRVSRSRPGDPDDLQNIGSREVASNIGANFNGSYRR